MSPGCATRLVAADGSRAFVKAVGLELNPRTPFLFRREVTALTLIGSHELWAGMRASYDDGDWVAVMLEDVEGEHPDLDDDGTMDLLLRQTERLGQVLAERVPDPPAPDPENGGLSGPPRDVPRVGRRRGPRGRDPAGAAARLDPSRHRDLGAARARPGRARRAARALGHPQRQPPAAPHRRAGLPRLGRRRCRAGLARPAARAAGARRGPVVRRRPGLLPGARGGRRPRGGRLARGLRGLPRLAGAHTRSTSTCRPSTISGSASRGACWWAPNGAWASPDLA